MGRLPATVGTKLLVTFVGTVVLLVVLGVLGLRVLGDSNDRIERLGSLHVRATAYREIETFTAQLRVLLGVRAGGPDMNVYAGGTPSTVLTGDALALIDQTIISTVSRFDPVTDVSRLDFQPPPDERVVLDTIRKDYVDLSAVMTKIIGFDHAGRPQDGLQLQHDQAEPVANELESLATGLVDSTLAQTNALIADNRTSFSGSQLLFVAVAVASIVLALLLGYALSRSLIGPIRLMEARLEAISSGDFSGHVNVPNRDELGSLAAGVNRMNDELGRLYRELETTSRHKSEFLANMSHELRTPLNAIIGFSEVLSEQMFGELNPKQIEYLDDIRSSGKHLLALINDILDLSKVEAGQMELQPSEFSLPAVLESGMTMVRERAARQGVEIALDVHLEREVISADERKIKQVVFNLLSNAVKFTPSGGRVEVRAHDDPSGVEIAVHDTGVGIARQDHARIFDAFQQLDQGASGSQEGTGLGLGLAKRFVELHGGSLTVESEPGRGSTFTVRLPLLHGEEVPA